MRFTHKILSGALCAALCLSLFAGGADASAENSPAALTLAPISTAVTAAEAESDAVLITLSDDGSRCADSSVQIDGGTVTITAAGDYLLTGSLSDGQILVSAPEDAKVKLILNGVSIVKSGHAAIYALSADKLVLSTQAGSENLLQSTGEFVQTDENKVDAAVFAKCDLSLSGEGVLSISCLQGHAVVSKDDLTLKSGTVNLEAGSKGLSGKDSVSVEGGILNADVGTDALYSANGEDSAKGTITVTGGTLNLLCQKDGLDATGAILIEGGAIVLNAGNGSEGKGLVSEADVTISGGSLNISSYDDAVHAGGSVTIRGGELLLASSDDGIHADDSLCITGGSLSVTRSYEGLEARVIDIQEGRISVRASDDGLNAAGGSDGSDAMGLFGGDSFRGGMGGFESDSGASLTISGGTLTVNADGDGLDSNGALTVSGGTVYVSGPTNSGNGAMDYGIEASISGGTVLAAGAAGMAVNFGQSSTQGSILLNLSSTQAAGSTVTLCDESGTVLASFQPEKSYSSVLISTEGLVQGGVYTVTAGTETRTVTLDSLICGGGMGMGGFGGPMGGHGFGGQGFGGGMGEAPEGFDPSQAGGMQGGQGFDPSQAGGTQGGQGFDPSQTGGFGGHGMGPGNGGRWEQGGFGGHAQP